MPKLNYIQSDLLSTDKPVIAHSLSLAGVYGAGVAKQIAIAYPKARLAYLKYIQQGKFMLGSIQTVRVNTISSRLKYIVNMIGQSTYGRTGIHVDYNAMGICFDKLFSWCESKNLSVALPRVGSGLAGGSWDKIEGILLSSLTGYGVAVDVHYL